MAAWTVAYNLTSLPISTYVDAVRNDSPVAAYCPQLPVSDTFERYTARCGPG